jgi:hypothetical protein
VKASGHPQMDADDEISGESDQDVLAATLDRLNLSARGEALQLAWAQWQADRRAKDFNRTNRLSKHSLA